jgi:hypothetical protein
MQVLRTACLLVFVFVVVVIAQQTPPAPPAAAPAAKDEKPAGYIPPPSVPADLQELVNKQFGPNFKVIFQRHTATHYLHESEHAPLNTLLTGDLDGDGIEDAVIVAKAKNAFSGQIPYNYRIIDPYYSAFGYGNPQITGGMMEEDPDGNYLVLVIHGAGPDAWRAARPKAKFVMINLPFNTINVAPMAVDKKQKHKNKEMTADQIAVIILEEDGTNQSSIVIWDGKKYRWRDLGGPE